ncbi:nucleotidyltransferase family protein [Microvirga sp. 0TCS3.31]
MIVRRGVLTDHYVEDERSVVMVDESVLGLSPVATAILEAVPEGVEVGLATVTQHVVATFGPPAGTESAEALTEQQIWDLVAHRVLVLVETNDPAPAASPQGEARRPAPAGGAPASAVIALRDALRHLRSDNEGRWSAPDALSPDDLLAAARQHHVVPYLSANLDRLDLPTQASAELTAVAGRQRAGAKLLAADLAEATDALDAFGVRALAFKGVALATQSYGDFAIRGAGDLDLLVPPSELVAAYTALMRAGWKPSTAFPVLSESWAWRHFLRTGNELTLSRQTSDIDLHWHLAPVRGTFPDFEALWGRRSIVSVDGYSTPTLAPYDALAHSCSHAAKDGWRWLRSLLDVHTLLCHPETWQTVDRPLRSDQLISLGMAARAFGTPSDAPSVVAAAADNVAGKLLARVLRDQDETAPMHQPLSVPGLDFMRRMSAIGLTGASPSEVVRLVSRSVLPPWLTASEPSPTASVAVPRVLLRRAAEVGSKVDARRRRDRT